MRKVFCFILLLILCLSVNAAVAEMPDEAEILSALHLTGVDQPIQLSQWGDTAACLGLKNGQKALCVLERSTVHHSERPHGEQVKATPSLA